MLICYLFQILEYIISVIVRFCYLFFYSAFNLIKIIISCLKIDFEFLLSHSVGDLKIWRRKKQHFFLFDDELWAIVIVLISLSFSFRLDGIKFLLIFSVVGCLLLFMANVYDFVNWFGTNFLLFSNIMIK